MQVPLLRKNSACGYTNTHRGKSTANASASKYLCNFWVYFMLTSEARQIQQTLRRRVRLEDDFSPIEHVAGVDVGFVDNNQTARAAVAVLNYPSLQLVESAIAHLPVTFPYIPGYLSFREAPVIIEALRAISTRVDLLVCDGQGYAHPRRFGLACHLGVELDIPAIGVAKTRLIGDYRMPGERKSCRTRLLADNETIGYVLRTRAHTKPLFVSAGHRVAMETAARLTLSLCPRFRLPETTRAAHRLASG